MDPSQWSLAQIRAYLDQVQDPQAAIFQALAQDPRKGAQEAATRRLKHLAKLADLRDQQAAMLAWEGQALQAGYQAVAGVDEVGRGPLAGPVVAAAVILGPDLETLLGVRDSKALTASQRTQLASQIKAQAQAYAISQVDPDRIDQVNIYEASKEAMVEALNQLPVQPDYLLVDAMTLPVDLPQRALIKGDQVSLSIAAASILAKVYRDQVMAEYGQVYPDFGFQDHKGYPTPSHLKALETHGYTPIHRQSFAPVARIQRVYSGP